MVLTTRSFASVQIPSETYQTHGPALLGRVSCHMMVELMKQIGQVSEYASDIFGGLFEETKQTGERIGRLVSRIETVESMLPALDQTYMTSDPSVFYTTAAESNWKRQDVITDRIFSAENRPAPIAKICQQAFVAPNVGLLNSLTGNSCEKLYSNPDYFFDQWLIEKEKEILREKETKSAKRKKKKKNAATQKMQVTAIEVKKFSQYGAEFGVSTESIVGSTAGAQQAQALLQEKQQAQRAQIQIPDNTTTSAPSSPKPKPPSTPRSASSNISPLTAPPVAPPRMQPAIPEQNTMGDVAPPPPTDSDYNTYSSFAPPPPMPHVEDIFTPPPPSFAPTTSYPPPPSMPTSYQTTVAQDEYDPHPPQAIMTQDNLYNIDVPEQPYDYGTYHAPSPPSDAPRLDEIFNSVQQSRPAPPAPAPAPAPPLPSSSPAGVSPPASSMPPRPNPFGAGKSGLLSAIQAGAKLNKVEVQEKPAEKAGGRNNLLSAIQQGTKLRTVQVEDKPKPAAAAPASGGLGAVMNILSRRKALQDSDDDDDDDDDSW